MAKRDKRDKSARAKPPVVQAARPRPWGTLATVAAIVVFAAGVFGFVYLEYDAGRDQRAALAPYTPSADNRDPSLQIKGVTTKDTTSRDHVAPDQRVAYETRPPLGGPHDGIWASCSGTVYDTPVRTENMVHSMEHGAVWIAYDPVAVTGSARKSLIERVEGQDFTMLSPQPGLDSPISLQSWGHQLRVERADDPRIDQFIQALKVNQYTHPEVGATCQAPGAFDPDDPPPFDPTPPGPDAVPVGVTSGRGTDTPGR